MTWVGPVPQPRVAEATEDIVWQRAIRYRLPFAWIILALPLLYYAPPIPGHNRARSNSEAVGGNAAAAAAEPAPQLAGLFAGGMPKLKKRGGGVDTGGTFPLV